MDLKDMIKELENWNKVGRFRKGTTVRITVFPAEDSNPVMKSKAICDQGQDGMGCGQRNLWGGELLGLDCAHTRKDKT